MLYSTIFLYFSEIKCQNYLVVKQISTKKQQLQSRKEKLDLKGCSFRDDHAQMSQRIPQFRNDGVHTQCPLCGTKVQGGGALGKLRLKSFHR